MSVANDSRPPYHRWQSHGGKTLKWLGTDTQLLYDNNCHDPEQRARLERAGWYPYSDIDYQFNYHGFRTDEFDSSPRILTLGCSYTQGVGLHRHQIWTEVLVAQLGIPAWNLGVGGGSLDTCFRLLEYWIDHLNVEAVVVLVPHIDRVEVVLNDARVESCGPWSNEFMKDFYKCWIDHSDNSAINRRKNILAMESICNQRQIPILFYYPETEFRGEIGGGKARDLLHNGAGQHLRLAHKIKTDLQGLLP